MASWRAGLFDKCVDAPLRRLQRNGLCLLAAIFCVMVSLLFATLAGFECLRAANGPVFAALMISLIYLALALMAMFTSLYMRRVDRARAMAASIEKPMTRGMDMLGLASSLVGGLITPARTGDGARARRSISPMEAVALALACGILFGRRLRK